MRDYEENVVTFIMSFYKKMQQKDVRMSHSVFEKVLGEKWGEKRARSEMLPKNKISLLKTIIIVVRVKAGTIYKTDHAL